jgi:hypothetical protein
MNKLPSFYKWYGMEPHELDEYILNLIDERNIFYGKQKKWLAIAIVLGVILVTTSFYNKYYFFDDSNGSFYYIEETFWGINKNYREMKYVENYKNEAFDNYTGWIIKYNDEWLLKPTLKQRDDLFKISDEDIKKINNLIDDFTESSN